MADALGKELTGSSPVTPVFFFLYKGVKWKQKKVKWKQNRNN